MKVGIFGLGLDGAGLGIEIRASLGRAVTVVGFDEDGGRARKARSVGAIDDEASDSAALAALPVVFVAVEPAALDSAFRTLSPHLRPGTVVSDLNAVKSPGVMLASTILPSGVSFVGSHLVDPGGPSTDVYDGRRIWCLIPGQGASADAIATIRDLAVAADYRTSILTAGEHDLSVAATQHLPTLARAALLSVVVGSAGWRDLAPFAADLEGSAKTVTPTPPDFVANQEAITHWLDRLQAQLVEIKALLAAGDTDGIAQLLGELAESEARIVVSRDEPREPGFSRRVFDGLFGDRLAKIVGRRPVP